VRKKSTTKREADAAAIPLVISTGCPCSIGPELSLRVAGRLGRAPCILVGDVATLLEAADLVGVPRSKLRPSSEFGPARRGVFVHQAGPELGARDRKPGRPGKRAGVAQLAYIEEAARLAQRLGAPLVTAAVSKAAIAGCGETRASGFLGHTEWLQAMAGVERVTMCFWTPAFSTALVTTHLPISAVPKAIDASSVAGTALHLHELLQGLGVKRPRIAVASLNPHAGEGGLLGKEEAERIVPGIELAQRKLRQRGSLVLTGAETAYRLAARGQYDGVVAMYHDQATIPTKLIAFGEAVNVTVGLGYVRTSVDHGTGYDIAWQGVADPAGLRSAMKLALRLRVRSA
jgi:4-phospho-D-threonate 3-dehydrogenase / 4-phospho-D-erythronate 3-dehydrogenase